MPREPQAIEEDQSFWPELTPSEITPAVNIMQTQAGLLPQKSHGKLDALVKTLNSGGDLVHTFYIVAPALQNYRYELFEVEHGVMPYPVRILSAPKGTMPTGALETEKQFRNWLKAALSSEETKRVIGALLAQV